MSKVNAQRGLAGIHSRVHVTPSHLAATATEEYPVFVAPFPCLITGLAIIPQAAVTGADTNTTHLNVKNKGSAGSGTTEIANKDLVSGTNLAAFDLNTITLTGTTAQKTLAEGDVLSLEFEKVGTGLLVPSGMLQVSFEAL